MIPLIRITHKADSRSHPPWRVESEPQAIWWKWQFTASDPRMVCRTSIETDEAWVRLAGREDPATSVPSHTFLAKGLYSYPVGV